MSSAVDLAVGKSYQEGRYPLLFKGDILEPGLEPFNKKQTWLRGLGCSVIRDPRLHSDRLVVKKFTNL